LRPPEALPLAADRAEAVALAGNNVSRETWDRLDVFVELLLERQRTTNLIAASTIPQLWTRHVADSLQLLPLAPRARRWIDLGSGGGFPGIVVACALSSEPNAEIHLVESRKKKAAFLQEVVHALKLPAHVHAVRLEEFGANSRRTFDAVTARALAPLDLLLEYSIPLLKKGAVGVFPKGQDVAAELTQASKSWNIEAELVPSRTDPAARIVVVRNATRLK
jgi:16S rRNA (guanine527-N7)-methyltransferase